MDQIRVALDTSSLRRDPMFAGAAMEALARFAEEGYIELIIPRIVANEFATMPTSKRDALETWRNALHGLRKQTPVSLHDKIAEFERELQSQFTKIETAAATRLDAWLERTCASLEDVRPEHAARVLASYFSGGPPFKKPKSREDFPDAFIFEIISDLAREGEIIAVISDRNLREALEPIANLTVYSNAKELIASERVAELRTLAESENVQRLIDAFSQDAEAFRETIEDGIVDRLAGRLVSYRSPYADEKEGLEKLYIELVGPILEWRLEGEAEYLGEGVITIDFSARVEVEVDMSVGSDLDDELYGSESDRLVAIAGTLSVKLDVAELKRASFDWSGADLLDLAEVRVDDVDSIDLVEPGY